MSHIVRRICPILHVNWLRPIGVAVAVVVLAHAATITVPCSGSGGGPSGLVAAINRMNSTFGPNTINLTPGCIYTFTHPFQVESPNGLPPITGIITVNGYGATIARSQASGTPPFRIFAVASGGNLTLNVAIVKGGLVNSSCVFAVNNNCDPFFEQVTSTGGGGLTVDAGGKLTLNHTVITENRAALSPPEPGGFSQGGGIDNSGIVILNNSVVSKNVAFSATESGNAQGGGIYNRGQLTVWCSTVTHNTAEENTQNDAGNAHGGGIFSPAGRLIVRQSVMSYNTVSSNAPGDAQAIGGGIEVGVGSAASLAYNVIRNNTATAFGGGSLAVAGGIHVAGTATLYHVAIFGNVANSAAGLEVAAGGGLVIAGCQPVTGGSTCIAGKAKLLYTVIYSNTAHAPNGYALGGGIDNGGTATLAYSKVANNTAAGGTLANSLGGGIYNADWESFYFNVIPVSGSLTLINSQVAGNHPDQCDPTGSVLGCSN
jgi:hypothetical protein